MGKSSMKSLAAILVFVIIVFAGLPGCGWQEMSSQEKIRTVSRILEVVRPSRPHTYDPTLEERIRSEYSSLHFKIRDVSNQHIALTEDVLRQHTLPID